MENLSKIFSGRLRAFRGSRSQAEFAKYLGIDNQATYHRYEAGRIPKPEILSKIAYRLGVTTDYLLGRTSMRQEMKNTAKLAQYAQSVNDADTLNACLRIPIGAVITAVHSASSKAIAQALEQLPNEQKIIDNAIQKLTKLKDFENYDEAESLAREIELTIRNLANYFKDCKLFDEELKSKATPKDEK
jgi:transcriptional regulator with XRE-family HTH domain